LLEAAARCRAVPEPGWVNYRNIMTSEPLDAPQWRLTFGGDWPIVVGMPDVVNLSNLLRSNELRKAAVHKGTCDLQSARYADGTGSGFWA
jgi:hypothetical protein